MSEKSIGVKLPAHDWGVLAAAVDSLLFNSAQLRPNLAKDLARIREVILEAMRKAEKWPADW
jgi:hypothetical protein